jgi:hypothetical protein
MLKDCIKKAATCGHRDWNGKCGIFGCIVSHLPRLTPMQKFVFGLNPYEKRQIKKLIGGDKDV